MIYSQSLWKLFENKPKQQLSHFLFMHECINETIAIADNRFFLPMSGKLFLNSGEKHVSAAERNRDLLHEIKSSRLVEETEGTWI